MNETSTSSGSEHPAEPEAAGDESVDEAAAWMARIRSARRPGAVNGTRRWQVRISWGGTQQWPPFTFDAKDSRGDAECCARQAAGWSTDDADLFVIETWIRGPGASVWESVAAPQACDA